jgi:hypothetical protein
LASKRFLGIDPEAEVGALAGALPDTLLKPLQVSRTALPTDLAEERCTD